MQSANQSTSKTGQKTVFSGIQPSNQIMLGNYLGAVKNWAALQPPAQNNDCLFCLVDLHAITIKQDPKLLRERSYEGMAILLAAGLDPKKNILFLQSHVYQHTELSWLLECHAYMGELNRMTQFKDKGAKQKNVGAGLFTYPVLMAADILLYQTNLVPVGQDQKQHLELARDIAIRMNNTYGPLFAVPEPYIAPMGAKIMSLQDPLKKMSKSDPDPSATIFLADEDEVIRKKLKRAVTDSGSEITFLPEEKPGVSNLLTIQSAITGTPIEQLVASYQGKQYGHLKLETAEIVIECLRPIREQFKQLLNDRAHLDQLMKQGAHAAAERAEKTVNKVKEAIGFIGRR